ncbi:MAG: hypothetical protein M0R77_00750 [Gammaproteobacteria bacterium]|nr:hypothetical protein [Gammaproteobacteria bacterium]
MSNTPFLNPLGIDGRALVQDPYSTWKIWNYSEIYFGAGSPSTAIYIPKVNDLILNLDEGIFYIVLQIDPVSYIPVIKRYVISTASEEDGNGLLLGVGVGSASELNRVYINKTTIPYSAVVDRRKWVGGSDAAYAIAYRGSPVSGSPMEVISIMYDTNSSTILGNEIPLEDVTAPGFANCKVIKPFYTKVDLQDNEIVTIIVYNNENTAIERGQLLVENTAWIRDQTDSLKYIVDIFCTSPFIKDTDPDLIVYPLNLPKNALNLFGTVLYSDGEQRTLPVNGGKFSMMGLSGFVATYPNQTDEWVLNYQLDQNEAVHGAVVGQHYSMTKPYRVKVTQVQGMYSVKLFGFPVWINAVNGYTMRWFLYSLERQEWFDVTPYVRVGANSPAFDPTLYGVNQQIQWVIELKDVDPVYGDWTHTQVINIALMRQGTEVIMPRWTVRDQGQAEPYGRDIECQMTFINQNLRQLNFGSGLATKAQWLEKAYYELNPLYNSLAETKPIEPDYIKIRTGSGLEMEISVDDWNSDIPTNLPIVANETLFLHFVKRTADSELQLAVGGWSVRQL